jgi:transposase
MIFDRRGLRVFVYRDPIDMRCGFEKLHSFCVHQMNAVMDQGHLYIFFGKNRRRMKLLSYDGSGLVLIAKRIERGQFMALDDLLGRSEITIDEMKLIMHGSIIRKPVVDRSMPVAAAREKIFSTQWESFALPQSEMQSPL